MRMFFVCMGRFDLQGFASEEGGEGFPIALSTPSGPVSGSAGRGGRRHRRPGEAGHRAEEVMICPLCPLNRTSNNGQ